MYISRTRAQARGDLGRNSHLNLAHFGRIIDIQMGYAFTLCIHLEQRAQAKEK